MSLPTPITRKETLLNAAATGVVDNLPEPITREESYLKAIAENGGGGGGAVHVQKVTIGSMTGRGSLPAFTAEGEKVTFSAGALPTMNSVTVVSNVTGGGE